MQLPQAIRIVVAEIQTALEPILFRPGDGLLEFFTLNQLIKVECALESLGGKVTPIRFAFCKPGLLLERER